MEADPEFCEYPYHLLKGGYLAGPSKKVVKDGKWCSSLVGFGFLTETFGLKYPHKKKSQRVSVMKVFQALDSRGVLFDEYVQCINSALNHRCTYSSLATDFSVGSNCLEWYYPSRMSWFPTYIGCEWVLILKNIYIQKWVIIDPFLFHGENDWKHYGYSLNVNHIMEL